MDDPKNSHITDPLVNQEMSRRVLYLMASLILVSQIAVFLIYLSYRMNREMVVTLVSALPIIFAVELNRRGYVQTAGNIIAICLSIMITGLATLGGGIYDIGVVAYPAILIIASLLLRRYSIIYLTILIVGCAAWLVFGAIFGLYQPIYPGETLPRQFVFVTIILLVTAAAIQVLSNTLRKNADLLQQELDRGRQTEKALRDAEALYRNIVEKTSVITYRDSAEINSVTLYISPQIESVLGFKQAEWLSEPGFWLKVTHPDDFALVSTGIENLLMGRERNVSEYRMMSKDGRWVWFRDESVLVRAGELSPEYIQGVLFNITERKNAESEVKQREAILSSVAETAQHLLRASTWRNEIDDILKLLGEASGASHVYIFENHGSLDDEAGLSSMTFEWVAAGMHPELNNPEYQNTYLKTTVPGLEDWYSNLRTGKPFYGSAQQYQQYWREVFTHKGLKTLLDVPIFVNDKWWGIIGFDDYINEMPWSQAEIDALMAAAGMLGTAISREHADVALRNSEEKFQVAFHRTFVPMIISRAADEIILNVNQAFCDGVGYARDEVIGTTAGDLRLWVHAEDQLKHQQTLAEKGYEEGLKTEFRRKSGEVGVALLSGVVIYVGDETCLLHTFHDITKVDELLSELKSRNEELQSFTYTVSHDLRAPLITLSGFIGYMEEDARKGNLERVLKDSARIKEAVQKMERLLNELLELSRIGRLMNPPQDVPFGEIVQEALQSVQGRLVENKIEVIVQTALPVARGDRLRLVEVVQNLVDNAAKFMGHQKNPLIKIGVELSSKGTVFFVEDNGVGIDPAYHEKIFGLFNKLDTNTEGTGIGLALVKRIVEVHGGQVWVESQGVGSGSRFSFTLTEQQSSKD